MAGSARFTVVFDACVLYPQLVRDTLLSLAASGLFHARWSAEIHDEWTRNLALRKPELGPRLPTIVAAMNAAIPDCLVTGHMSLVDSLVLPDPDDRHVLAAAITGHADAIVTANLSDFPSAVLGRFNIEVIHPDDFIVNQLQLHQLAALTAFKKMRARWRQPSHSAAQMLELMEHRGLIRTADHLRKAVELI